MPILSTRTAHFSDLEETVKEHLRKAQKSVLICVAWISHRRYSAVFSWLTARGVDIKVIMNDDRSNSASFPRGLVGIEQRRLNAHRGLMHSKFCVIDETTVLMGSFNWSANSVNHFENLDVTTHDYRYANSYIRRFNELWRAAETGKAPAICCGAEDEDSGRKCRAGAFNIGIIGGQSGEHLTCDMTVWRLCRSYHARLIHQTQEDYLWLRLGLEEGESRRWGHMPDSREEAEWDRVNGESTLGRTVDYFQTAARVPVHALGTVAMINENEYLEYGESPEYAISVFWKDVRFESRVDLEYPENGSEIDDVISYHRGL